MDGLGRRTSVGLIANIVCVSSVRTEQSSMFLNSILSSFFQPLADEKLFGGVLPDMNVTTYFAIHFPEEKYDERARILRAFDWEGNPILNQHFRFLGEDL